MNTVTILTRIEPDVKLEAKRFAKKLGLSLSGFVNRLIKDHVTTRRAEYSEEHPTQYMIDELRKSEEDYEAGRVIRFDSIGEAQVYLMSEIKDEKIKERLKHRVHPTL